MARQSQLVSQHLENISHEALSKYQDVIRSYPRGHQGIQDDARPQRLYEPERVRAVLTPIGGGRPLDAAGR